MHRRAHANTSMRRCSAQMHGCTHAHTHRRIQMHRRMRTADAGTSSDTIDVQSCGHAGALMQDTHMQTHSCKH
eukprot:3856706-Alexandrium_andersonii.AAC.1